MSNESSLFMTQLARKETILNNPKLIENSFIQIIHIDLINLFLQMTSPTADKCMPKVISDHTENVKLFR